MRVIVGNDIKIFTFQPNTKISDAKVEIIEKIGGASRFYLFHTFLTRYRKMNAEDYGLRIEVENTSVWIDETLEMKDSRLEA